MVHFQLILYLSKSLKKYDVIIGMYHDQVLSPMKALFDFDAINITLGLTIYSYFSRSWPKFFYVG